MNIADFFPKLSLNKGREIERLIFEISKIENIAPQDIALALKDENYKTLKTMLLARRYPNTFNNHPLSAFYLPKLDNSQNLQADISKDFYPQEIYFPQEVKDLEIVDNAKSLFPKASFTELPNDFKHYHELAADKEVSPIEAFNKRTSRLFIVKERFDFVKACPCSQNAFCCGYSLINLGMGCPYECSYCFLQGYQNISALVLPYNIDDYLKAERFLGIKKNPLFDLKRIGSGEWTDSLVFDHISGFSEKIIPFFRQEKDFAFEFKTKSLNIGNLLKIQGSKNIVAAWSLNSFKIQKSEEHKTPPVLDRLHAAKQCCAAGFSAGFHFDPIVFYEGWQKDYKEAVDALFDIVPNEDIKWISLGLLRMPASLKTTIEKRFPASKILDAELILDEDYKLRYSRHLRSQMFDFMIDIIKAKKSRAVIYLCMEQAALWKNCKHKLP